MTKYEIIFSIVVLWLAFVYCLFFGKKKKKRTIIQLERERLAWSLKTFPEANCISSLRKLEAEIKEVEECIMYWDDHNLHTPTEYEAMRVKLKEEYADCLKCLFDSAGRMGIYPQDIFDSFEIKLEKNKLRKWVKNADNSYSHIK
jgi:hypothetical protein